MSDTIVIRPVSSRRDRKAFLNLPFRLYSKDPLWAPQIRLFERHELHTGTNPVLKRSPHGIYLAEDNRGKTRGRIIAYEDPRYNAHHGTRLGFFGSFEADSPGAAAALFAAADLWFAGRGLRGVLGPIDPIAECWGFVTDGFDRPPVFLSPHNPRSYPKWTEMAGYDKAKDLLVYEMDSRKGYQLPERYRKYENKFLESHPGFSARPINMKDFDAEVERIVDITNRSVDGNWGFVPVEDDERDALAGKLKYIVDPDALWFIEDDGHPVACTMGFPDLNIPIRASGGRLFPLGWYHLIRAKRKLIDYRLWSLAVLPEYHGMGLDALLYITLYRSLALRTRGIRLEANYVLEDNPRIVIALEKLGLKRMKTYRVFEKTLKEST